MKRRLQRSNGQTENEDSDEAEATPADAVALYVFVGVLALLVFSCWASNEVSKRKLQQVLPEAEVKIQLAILKLEQKQAEKIAKNEH